MTERRYFDREEENLIKDYEKGEFAPVNRQQAALKQAKDAARRYLRKDSRINIRLSSADLEMLKQRAAEEGLPYQTLIASVLHKYASGRLVQSRRGPSA
jgi:predicted DNA binding CopG/RHH family protein